MLVRYLALSSIEITEEKVYLFIAYKKNGQWVDHRGDSLQSQPSFIRHLALFKADLNKYLAAYGYYLFNIKYSKESWFPALVLMTENGEKTKDTKDTIEQFSAPILLKLSQTINLISLPTLPDSPSSPKLFDYSLPVRAKSVELPPVEKVFPSLHKSSSAKK